MIENWFKRHFYPEQTAKVNEFQRELAYERSKSFFFIHLTIVAALLLFQLIPIERQSHSLKLWTAYSIIVLIAHFFFSKKFHVRFITIYSAFSLLVTISSTIFLEESVLSCYMLFYLLPMFFYMFTGDIRHYIYLSIGQIINAAFFVKAPTIKLIEKKGPETFALILVATSVMGQILMLAIMKHTDSVRIICNQRAALSELRKEEAERQRTFLLSFSHELRNLMNSVIGSIELCLIEEISEKMMDMLLGAKLCGKVLLQEINNILDSGKVEIGELEIHKTMQSSKSLFNKVWVVCGDLIKRKNLRGRMAVDKALPKMLEMDDGRITQIALNLVGNAVKFTEKGCIDIVIKWENQPEITEDIFEPCPYDEDGTFEKFMSFLFLDDEFDCLSFGQKLTSGVDVASPCEKGVLKLIIRDSGCGIAEEDLLKLFRKFSQVGTSSTKSIGTGLGLFISKHIINKMGGDIRVYSKKDFGTVFIIGIPMKVGSGEMPSEPTFSQLFPLTIKKTHSGRILEALNHGIINCMIVDDEEFNIHILTKFIVNLKGKVIETAKNGAQAVEKYKFLAKEGKSPQLITMDIFMPEMNGKDAVKAIRRFEAEMNLRPVVIIMISGNCHHSEISVCTDQKGEIRAQGFLKKPVNMEEFRELVYSVLSINQ